MRLGICGLGLIGSSVARALAQEHDIVGFDPHQSETVLADLGIRTVADLAAMTDCDLILLAAPTSVNEQLLTELMASGCRIPTADLGSVKEPVVSVWRADPTYPFVATHPMAGSERAGTAAGSADLFQGSAWAVVVEPQTDPEALAVVISVVVAVGAEAVPVSAPTHDRVVAQVSHLPHLLAGALGNVVAEEVDLELALRLAAGSFRDGTRVAASPPERTAEFIGANAGPAAAAARQAARMLTTAADLLDTGDAAALAAWLQGGHHLRRRYSHRTEGNTRRIEVADAEAMRDLLLEHRDSGLTVVDLAGNWITVQGDPVD